MNGITVREALAQLQVTRLAHFTPARNLWHILQDGQVRSSKDLADNAPEYFDPTDRERFDRNPDKICCSFQYPNGYYLSDARAKVKFVNYPDWVCLLLDPELVHKPGTKFCGCDAARQGGIHLREGGQALLDCFAKTAIPDTRWTRDRAHHPGAATDLQAEALIPGTVVVHSYRAACGQRAEQAAEAMQREPLQARLEARQQEERRAGQDRQMRADTARLVTEAGTACGLATDSPDATARELGKWSAERSAQMEQAAAAQKEWTDLQALLNGRSLEQLQKEAASSAKRAENPRRGGGTRTAESSRPGNRRTTAPSTARGGNRVGKASGGCLW